MDREKLLDRIRRLLRLAESSNVNEAANAAAAAQALMARHRIEEASLADDDTDGIVDHRDAPLDSSKRLRPWKIELAAVIARANGCRIYLLERGSLVDLVLVGRPDDVELVRLLYPDLVIRVESLTRRYGEGRDREFCNGFRLGAVTTIDDRLARANAEALAAPAESVALEPEARSDSALALRRLREREDAVDRFMDETLRLRKGKSKNLRADAEGYAQGRVAATTLGLGPTRERR